MINHSSGSKKNLIKKSKNQIRQSSTETSFDHSSFARSTLVRFFLQKCCRKLNKIEFHNFIS